MQSLTVEDVRILTPDDKQLERLLPVARKIFTDTFSHDYERTEFEKFCDSVYDQSGSMAADFHADGVHWQAALLADTPIGYAKLTPLRAPAATAAGTTMELQQLYVLAEWHGTGIAEQLMRWALSTAKGLGAAELYLTVFDHNERAKRFYARHGFEEVGRCTFQMGDRIDDDRIWRCAL